MKCKKAKNLFFVYLNNELKGKEKKEFEEHLETCSSCKKEFEKIAAFQKGIIFEELKTSSEMDLILIERVYKNKKTSLFSFLKKMLYPLIFALGLMIGIYLGFSLSNREKNKTFTILKESTFHIEPYLEKIKPEEVLNERE